MTHGSVSVKTEQHGHVRIPNKAHQSLNIDTPPQALLVQDVDRLLLKLINSPESSPELAGSVVRPSLPCCSGEGLFLPTDLKVI